MKAKEADLVLPYVFFRSEVIKLQEEARQQGFSAGIFGGIESTIMCIHHRSGLSAEQTVAVTGYTAQYIQETLDKFKDHPPKYFM